MKHKFRIKKHKGIEGDERFAVIDESGFIYHSLRTMEQAIEKMEECSRKEYN